MSETLGRLLSARWLRVCFAGALAVVTVLLMIGLGLELGLWRFEKTIRGPFPTEAGSGIAIVNVTGDFTAKCCLEVRADGTGPADSSTLRAWLNGSELGPPHASHNEIRTRTTRGFSHWIHLLYFSIPANVENTAATTLRVSYAVQYQRPLLRVIAAIAVLLYLAAAASLLWPALRGLNARVRAARREGPAALARLQSIPPARWLRASLPVALVIVTTALAGGIALDLGAWQIEKTLHGPFPVEAGSKASIVNVTGDFSSACCFEVRTDGVRPVYQSALRVWLNGRELGPSHVLHAEIRSGTTTGFSHWNHLLYFSIPGGVDNSAATTLRVTYPVQYWEPLFDAVQVAAVLLYLVAAVYYVWPALAAIALLHWAFRGLLVGSSLLLAAYAAAVIAGYAGDRALPVAYLFQLWPVAKAFNRFEPHFPLIAIGAALAAAAVSWLGSWSPAIKTAIRRQEAKSMRVWRWFGLTAVAGAFFLFIAAAAWSGNPSLRDLPYMNVAGLVHHSDAHGYFDGARLFLISGTIGDWNLRRPLAVFFRAITLVLGGYNYLLTILIQIALLSVAIFLATSFVIKWRGLAAGMLFFAMSFIMTRPFLATTLTESLALFWAFLSLPFIVRGVNRPSMPQLCIGFAMLTLALFIRMGAMFAIPAVIFWLFLFVGDDLRTRTRNAALGCLVAGGVVLCNYAIIRLFGAEGAQLGSNYAWTLCGMSIDGLWSDCQRRYAAELTALHSEGAQANFFYRITLENIRSNPWVFVGSMWKALARFLSDLPSLPVVWYLWPQQPYFTIWPLYAFAALGWITVLRRGLSARAVGFAVLLALGVLASAPLVYFEDARRVFAPVYPVWALAVAGGVFAPATLRLNTSAPARLQRYALAAAASVAVIVAMWAVLQWRYPEYRAWTRNRPPIASDEAIIAGRELQSGLVVLPDSAEPLKDTPSMGITRFREFLRLGNLDPSQSGYPLPDVPFGFTDACEWGHGTAYFFVPPNVILDRSVRRWRVKYVPANPDQSWVKVIAATPIP